MEIDKASLSLIIDTNPGDFAIYKLENGMLKTIYASENLHILSDMTKEEYNRVTIPDASKIVVESDRVLIVPLLDKFSENTRDIQLTYRIKHKTKNFIWIHAKARLIGTIDGCPALLVLYSDNSYETEEHTFLLDHVSAIVYAIDVNTHELLYANEPALKIWGHGNYCGQACYSYINGLSKPCPWCSIENMKETSYSQNEIYIEHIDKWLSIECHRFGWFGRNAAAVYAFDITEQKKHQESLEIDKKSLELIINNTPAGIGVCTVKNKTVSAVALNNKFKALMGLESDETSTTNVIPFDCVHKDDRIVLEKELAKLENPNEYVKCTFRFDRENSGSYQWYAIEAKSIENNEKTLAFICLFDITVEKSIEANERNTRRIYESSMEAAGLFVYEYDIKKRTVTLMDNNYTKRKSAEFNIPHIVENVPQSLASFLDAESMEKLLAFYKNIDSGKPEDSCIISFAPSKNISGMTLKLTYITVFDENGNPVKAHGTSQNITKQLAANDSYLREQLYFNNESSENLMAKGHYNLTRNQVITYIKKPYVSFNVNPHCEYDTAYEDFIKVPSLEKDRLEISDIFNRQNLISRFNDGKTSFYHEYKIEKENNTSTWSKTFVRTYESPDSGNIECFIYTFDVTSEHLEKLVLERMTDLGYDYIGIIDPASQKFSYYGSAKPQEKDSDDAGCNYDKSVKARILKCVAEDQREDTIRNVCVEKILSELEKSSSYSYSYDRLAPSGKLERKLLQYCYLDEDKKNIFFCKSDITKQHFESQKQLFRMKEALSAAEQANRAKTEFVSRISHDIRTPISIISNMTDFAFQDMSDNEKLENDLAKIKSADTFLLSLINDILDISKIDSGKITLNPEPYPYDEYIENIKNVLEPLCQKKGLNFVIERRHKTGVIVADKIRLNQITLNLLSNAVKYTPAGGTVTYISDSIDLPDGKIRHGFEIHDTGIGMSAEFQKKMFEPFSQEYSNPLRPKTESGTGLGLSIVKRDVDLMGGVLSVKSELGKGTVIRCETIFPDATKDPRYNMAAKAEIIKSVPAVLHGNVLLAEDNDVNAEIAVRILKSFGLDVNRAENGAKAVELFESSAQNEYSVILMDIQMPVMNGYEAAAKIRSLSRGDAKTIPILAMTADAFAEAVEKSKKAGMNGHITKPVNPMLLKKTLSDIIIN